MVPGFREFSGNNPSIKECMNQTEGRGSLQKLDTAIYEFLESPDIFGCPLPCERNHYTYNLNNIHENSVTSEHPDMDEGIDIYYLYFYYSTFQVEKHVETLIYDVGEFLAVGGGNLGLCLGFSCLSILLAFTHWTITGYKWLKNQLLAKQIK